MNKSKKIVITIITIVGLIIVLNLGLNFLIKKQLPRIMSEKNNTPYSINYKKININILSKNIHAENIVIIPKNKSLLDNQKLGIYSKVKSITIEDFKIWDIVFHDKIKASSITINNPEVVLYKKTENAINNSKNLSLQIVQPFQEIIVISKIIVNKGNLKIINIQTNKPILGIQNINIDINGIVINEASLNKKIPFLYKEYKLSGDSVYYRANEFYHITAQNIQTTNKNTKINKFKLFPEYSRREFVRKLSKEKDLFKLESETIIIKNMDWGFKKNKPYFNANKIAIEKLSANIYRNKLPKDDLSKKPLYNTLLREMQFPLKVDTLSIHNSSLVYEEEINFEKGPGMLRFNDFNLDATHIQSGYLQKKLKDINIDIDCKFMNNSPFKVKWHFNVLNKNDPFTFTGKIYNLKMEDLSRFTKPYINATTKGTFDALDFTIKGNDFNSSETASLKYHDLKITLYRKNSSQKKNILKSALANLIIKNDTDGETTTRTVTVERIPEKSFFNFLWLNIAEILKQIVI